MITMNQIRSLQMNVYQYLCGRSGIETYLHEKTTLKNQND